MAAWRLAARAWVWGILAGLTLGTPRIAEAEAIKIGLFKSAGATYIALEKGYFAAEGLSAELVFDAAPNVATATASGDVDFGASGISAALYNLAGHGALRIIGGSTREAPGFQNAALLASNRAYASGLKSYKELPGHTIGIAVIGGNYHYNLALIGEKYGFSLESVRLLPLQTVPNIASALIGGTVDAGLQTNTGVIPLLERGDAKLIGWMGDETPYQLGVLWTTTRTANERRPLVERFIRAYRKAARDFHDAFTGPNEERQDGPTALETAALIAKYLGQTPGQVRSGIGYIDPEARLDVKDVLHQIAWYKAQGMLKGDIDVDAIIDKRYVIPLP